MNLDHSLRAIRAQMENANKAAAETSCFTEGYMVQPPQLDPLDLQIAAYKLMKFELPPVPDRFKGLPNLMEDFEPVTYTFPDNAWLEKPGIELQELDYPEIIAIGREAIPMINTGFSRRGAAAILLLAYNLFSPESKYTKKIFKGYEEISEFADKSWDTFSITLMVRGTRHQVTNPGTIIEAATYTYIATSLLRLFTKSPDSYCKAWNHIRGGFLKFYGEPIFELLPEPNIEAVRSLAEWFRVEERTKVALFKILYIGNGDNTHQGLKKFLYETHLSNTGMHLSGFFVTLTRRLECTISQMLTIIDVPEFQRQVICLLELIKMSQNKTGKHSRRMFKYGRIFDETYMADIQTKSCARLTYIFGSALKQEDSTAFGEFDQIAQLSCLNDVQRKEFDTIARIIVNSLKRVK